MVRPSFVSTIDKPGNIQDSVSMSTRQNPGRKLFLEDDRRSLAGAVRLIIVLHGLLLLLFSLDAHKNSSWRSYDLEGYGPIRVHDVTCNIAKNSDVKCPSISMELFHVVVVISTFILSVPVFLLRIFVDLGRPPLKNIDLGYQLVSAILLMIAAILMLVSASQIDNLKHLIPIPLADNPDFDLRHNQKMMVARMAILQSLFHLLCAFLIVAIRRRQ